MHPEKARDRARELFVAVKAGGDPARDRRADREAPTVADLVQRVTEEHASMKKARTAESYEALFRLWVVPAFGASTPVAELDTASVEKLRRRCGEKRTTFNRAMALVSKSLNLAERWGWRPLNSNPVKHVERHRENKRETIMTPEQVASVWAALDAPDVMPSARAYFRLLILTGLRDSEWRKAMWSWVDTEARVLRLPDSKTGERIVALPDEAVEILKGLPRSSVYVLPGRTGGPMSGHRKIWARVQKAAGLHGVRIHDIRHTVGSFAHRAGATQRDVADLLGHKQLATAARYIHGLADERHQIAARTVTSLLARVK
jgi:integrase